MRRSIDKVEIGVLRDTACSEMNTIFLVSQIALSADTLDKEYLTNIGLYATMGSLIWLQMLSLWDLTASFRCRKICEASQRTYRNTLFVLSQINCGPTTERFAKGPTATLFVLLQINCGSHGLTTVCFMSSQGPQQTQRTLDRLNVGALS